MDPALTLDLTALAAAGPYFALDVGTAPADGADGWRPAAALVGAPDVLRAWVDWGAERMHTSDRVIVASILYQGWAARVTSIFAGSVILAGVVPDLGAQSLSYRYPPEGGAIGMAVERLTLLPPDQAWHRLVSANLEPLGRALRTEVRIGCRLLWGNVASAFAGSLAALDRAGHGPLARLVAAPWAERPELAGLGDWAAVAGAAPGAGTALRFRRSTCCLFERLPGAGRCGDCSLGPA
jgi:hypothetical protein